MKFVILFVLFICSATYAQLSWQQIVRIVPGCPNEDILDCVASFDGQKCVLGDVGFKRDCFECQCNHFGYWKCRNYCVKSWDKRATRSLSIPLSGLEPGYSVSPMPPSVYDQCIPGKKFLRDAARCLICYCPGSGIKSMAHDCKHVFWC